jgi:deazaflavin-dependent oxidoreductase (nitroreductase family)
MTSTETSARRAGDPAPDLTDYRVVHRAMTVDLDRLATAAAELVDRPDPARAAALRYYLHAVSGEIESHHQVEDDDVWPLLQAVAGDLTALVALTEDHDRLDPLLHHARELAALDRVTPELAAVLREVADLLIRHVADEERDIFPIIADRVGVEDYRRLQARFRGNLRLSLLPFLVPWAVRHATPQERPALLAEAGWPMRALLALFGRRFRAREELLFGAAGLSTEDRKLVRLMQRVNRLHVAVVRGTRGRVGHRWIGGSSTVLLTVTGRRTGRPHTVTLMALPEGDDFFVAASQGGVDREPHWWLNLVADPRAQVEFRGGRFAVVAEKVGGEERPAVWARFSGALGGGRFDGYQAKVRREIAVVRLRRVR